LQQEARWHLEAVADGAFLPHDLIHEEVLMLRVEIAKGDDGTGVLRCKRSDGSVTWQKQSKHSKFFALHDLMHIAVETTLGYRHGFFGLIDEGWDLDEVVGDSAGRPMPDEAIEVERIVALFDSERASGVLWTAAEFTSFAPRPLTQDEIQRVRSLRADLFKRWSEVVPGQRLEITFERQPAPVSR
jgi:hypothetical protein